MSGKLIFAVSLAVYLAGFTLTFGHAGANKICEEKFWTPCADQRVGAGLVSGFFWPLYWSLVAFEKGETE